MVCSMVVIILLVTVTLTSAKDLTAIQTGSVQNNVFSNLFSRMLKTSALHEVGADSTTLGKTSHGITPQVSSRSFLPFQTFRSPAHESYPNPFTSSPQLHMVPMGGSLRHGWYPGPLHSLTQAQAGPEGVETVPNLVAEKGSASIIRSSMVVNADGSKVPLGSAMGEGVSIVIFLRHLG